MKKFLKNENGSSELWTILTILFSVIIVMFYLRVIKGHKNINDKIISEIDLIKKNFKGENINENK